MSVIEEFIGTLFLEIFWGSIKRLGSFVRWLSFRKKWSYIEIYEQDWNGRIGLLTIALTISLVIGLRLTFFSPQNQFVNAQNDVKQLADKNEIKNGDLIFQTSLSRQSKAIQLATKSKYSHCGLIFKDGKDFFVFEAIQPVKLTPLDKWIFRGKDGKYVIKRLKNADQVLTSETLQKMKEVGNDFKGKNYDLTFEWSDDKIYCSELIWKIYQRATGIEIGKLQRLRDFELTNETVKQKMKERFGDKIPTDEIVISPAAIFDCELLTMVKEN